jgi:hypothetical protein
MMKNLIYAALLLLMVIGCNSTRNLDQTTTTGTSAVSDTVRIANDSLEYEVIIIDPGFSTWLASRALPRTYYSLSYLESKNRIWVAEYNSRVMQPQRYGNMYTMQIDYLPTIKYGLEVNYLLYNYLVYFQNANRQRLGGNVPSR